MTSALQVAFGGASGAGAKSVNEDAFAACSPDLQLRYSKGAIACIADGISSSENAKLASETSVSTFIQDYLSTPETWDVKTAGARVLSALNSWLNYQGQVAMTRHNGYVTTFTAVIFKSLTAHILHSGDCRLYRYRDGKLLQLTRDHSMARSNGQPALTRALGMESHLQLDYTQHSLRKDDIFMLTSDGVHDHVTHEELQKSLEQIYLHFPPKAGEGINGYLEEQACRLIDRAVSKNSKDNNTCLLIRILGVPLENIDEAHRNLTSRVIPPVLSPGNHLDDYTITRVLNNSTRSHIYLAEHPRYREPFVIKVPSESFAEDPLYLEAFIREQWVGRRINNPLVMKIHEPPANTRFLYHVCEYVPGITLRQWIYDNPDPSLSEVRRLTEQIISALRIFQRMRMLHRDLKPENIMVTPDGGVKLIDFGTVKVPGLDEISSPVKENVPVGSVDYIAPEYLMGDLGLYRSDIFSLGVIVYEMLTGKLPFKTLFKKDGRVNSYDAWRYQPAQSARRDIPLWLDLALEKACSPHPTQRYQAFSEFLHDLSTPNKSLLAQHDSMSLMEKNPTGFWRTVALVLLIAILLQFMWPYL